MHNGTAPRRHFDDAELSRVRQDLRTIAADAQGLEIRVHDLSKPRVLHDLQKLRTRVAELETLVMGEGPAT